MGIGTSDGEYYDDRLSHALASEPNREAQPLPEGIQKVYISPNVEDRRDDKPIDTTTWPRPDGVLQLPNVFETSGGLLTGLKAEDFAKEPDQNPLGKRLGRNALESALDNFNKPVGKYETQLTRDEEPKFQEWKSRNAPNDSGQDYDLRGAFKAGVLPDPDTGHMPDTWKKPNHPTFSDQSQYAKDRPDLAGTWDGDTYVPPKPRGFFDRLSIVNAVRGMSAGAEDAVTNFPQHFKEGLQGMINTIKGPGEAGQNKLPMWAVNEDTGEVNTSHQAIEKANNLAMLMIGAPAPVAGKLVDGTLGSFMGINSKTFDRIKALRAHGMESRGETPDAIWDATGTFKGADKRWRQEIDDKTASLKLGAFDLTLAPKGEKGMSIDKISLKPNMKDFFGQHTHTPRLPDVIDHPELFKAYDFLKSTKVVPLAQDLIDRGVEGMMDIEHNTIHLAPNLKQSQTKRVILHEVAHAIQAKEGFINGTDPHFFRPEGWDRVSKQLTDAEGWLKKQFEKKRLTPDQYDQYKYAVKQEDDFNVLSKQGVYEAGEELIPSLLEDIKDTKNLGVYKQLKNIVEGERLLREADAKYYENYMRAAGEVEARNVQARMNYSANQRAAVSPVRTESRSRAVQQDEVGIPLELRHKMQDILARDYSLATSSEPTTFRRAANENIKDLNNPNLSDVEQLARKLAETENGKGSWDRIGGGGQEHYWRDAEKALKKSRGDYADSGKGPPGFTLEQHFDETVTKPHNEFIRKIDELHKFGQEVLTKKGGWTELNVARYNKMGRNLGGEWEDVKFE